LATNWTANISGGPDAAGDTATIAVTGVNGAQSIALFNSSDAGDATKTVGGLTLSNSGSNTPTLTISAGTGGGTLDFNNNGSNATLLQTGGSNTIAANVSLTSSLNVTNQNGNGNTNRLFLSGVVSGNGGLLINGPGTTSINGIANTFSGGGTVNSGTLALAGGTGASSSASAIGTGTLTISGGAISAGSSTAGTVTTNNIQAWNGDFSFSGGFALNMGTGAVTMSANRTITNGNSTTVTVGGAIGDNGNGYGLTLLGTGKLALGGASTYTGTTTISAGTLLLGSGGTTGSLSTSSAIVNNSTLGFNRTNTTTQGVDFASVVSGTGGVTQSGSGTTVLNGANTFTGATVISAGTLSVASLNSVVGGTASSNLGAPVTVSAGTIGMGATTVTGGLTYTGSGETTDRVVNLAGTTGGASITHSGTGLLKFTSSFTATGAGLKTLTLQGSTAGIGEIGGAIVNSTSATSVTKAGTGTWVLSGANTYTGATTINGGALFINNSIGSGAVAVNSTGALGGSGTIGGAATAAAGSFLAPGAGSGVVGTLTFSSTLSIAGLAGGTNGLRFDLGAVGASDKIVSGALTIGSGVLDFSDFNFNTVAGFNGGIYTLFSASSIVGTLGTSLTGTINGASSQLSISGNDIILTVAAIPEPSTYAALFGALALGGAVVARRRRG